MTREETSPTARNDSPTATVRAALVALSLVAAMLAGASPSAAEPVWLPTVDLSVSTGSAANVRIVTDRDGNATAVWMSRDGSSHSIQTASRPAGGTWSAPLTVPGSHYGSVPDVVVDRAGNITVAWLAEFHYIYVGGPFPRVAYDIRAATRSAHGTWSEQTAVTTGAVLWADDPRQGPLLTAPHLAVDPTGLVTAAWSRSTVEGHVVESATKPADEGGWSVSTTVGAGASPSMAVARDGVVTMVWLAPTDGGNQLRAASRPRGGTWTPPVDIGDLGATRDDSRPDIAVDGAGTATSVWRDHEEGVVLTSSRTAGGAWTTPAPLSTGPLPLSLYPPHVAAAADGQVWAVWSEDEGETIVTRAAGRNAGGEWSAPVDLATALDGATGPAALAASSEGHFVFVGGRSSGSHSVIVSARTIGGSRWGPAAEIPVADRLAGGPDVATDAAGNAVAAWFVGAPDGPHTVQAAALDAAGPILDRFEAPATGTAGKPSTFSALAHDVWSPIASYAWTFGDGGTASGASVAHTYQAEGRYTASLTVTDGVGNVTTRSTRVEVQRPLLLAPRITRFDLSRHSIRALGRAVPRRTELKVRLTTGATVKVVFKSKHKHRSGGVRHHHRVVMKRRLPPGRSSIIIKARVGGRELREDTYVLTGTARNSHGTSPKVRARLHVVRPRHP